MLPKLALRIQDVESELQLGYCSIIEIVVIPKLCVKGISRPIFAHSA